MTQTYFSDRQSGPRPRVEEEISQAAWGGIIAVVKSRITDDSFGYKYPYECPDGRGNAGCNGHLFSLALKSEIPTLPWPLDPNEVPPTLAILDLLEFCYRAVGKPVKIDFHSYHGHWHMTFGEPEEGRADFRDEVNRILARNGLAYELDPNGMVVRLAPEGLREALGSAVFRTGDAELDSLLEAARAKYLDPDPNVRKESLEKLWDAWERLKTIEPGEDKKSSATALLDKVASEPTFRAALEREALELTDIGNSFRIRHSETTTVPLERSEHVDYLFHRLFALIWLLLRSTDRGG